MIAVGETTAALRRIYFTIYVADGSVLASDGSAAVSVPAHALKVSINGANFDDALGAIRHVANGLYYYEADPAEIAAAGFLLVFFSRAGFRDEMDFDFVGQCFALGETDPTKLRVPFTIWTASVQPPALATGATVGSPSDLLAGINGSLGNAAGTLREIGFGAYYYQGVAGDASVAGVGAVEYVGAGFLPAIETFIVASAVSGGGGGGGDSTPPTVTVVSPAPGVTPGAPGGFSANFQIAANTAVVVQVTDAALEYFVVIVRFENGVEEVVYRRGSFRGAYLPISTIRTITNGFELSVRRLTGWPAGENSTIVSQLTFAVDATDTSGNLDA